MAEFYRTLGQVAPPATTITDAFVATEKTVVSSIIICNRGASGASFRISVAPAGAADDLKQYYYYDLPFASGNDTFIATIGVGMEATDVIRVYASNGNLSFNITGVEVTT